jgi:hypothetical protein
MHKQAMPHKTGQAGANESLAIRGDEFFKRVERLRCRLQHIQHRWDNRLASKNCSFAERYFGGNGEIVIYGKWRCRSNNLLWAVRIPADGHVLDDTPVGESGVDVVDFYDGCCRKEVVVLVEIAMTGDCPKKEVLVPARAYFFEDKFRSVGEGLLYRRERLGGFQVFPFVRKGKVKPSVAMHNKQRVPHPVVKCFSKVVDSVSHDRAEMLIDWLFGRVGQIKNIRLYQKSVGSSAHERDRVEIFGEGGAVCDKCINVAFGPFNL